MSFVSPRPSIEVEGKQNSLFPVIEHFFIDPTSTTTSETKETIIIEDEPEDDDTEKLYQSAFIKTEETCPIAR